MLSRGHAGGHAGVMTSRLKLVVFLGLEDRVGDPEPGVVLPELGDDVVGDEAHRPGQRVQHDGHKGLRSARKQTTTISHDRKKNR